jgi:hypothetical protein
VTHEVGQVVRGWTDEQVAERGAHLEALEQLWRDHHRPDISTARGLAESLRCVWGGYSVLQGLAGNLVDEARIRLYTAVLDAAAQGKLTPQHLANLSTMVRGCEHLPAWLEMLRFLLERQAEEATVRRGPKYNFAKPVDAWTPAEIRAYNRDYSAYPFAQWKEYFTPEPD